MAASETQRKGGRTWPRRLLIVAALIVPAILVAAVGYVGYLWWRVPEDHLDPMRSGTLSLSLTTDTRLAVAPYTVTLHPGPDASVTIAKDDLVLWRSVPGASFLAAGIGSVQFTDHNSFYWADVSRTADLVNQSVTQAAVRDGAVELTGTLAGDDESADYRMRLRPVVQSGEDVGLAIDVPGVRTDSGQEVSSVVFSGALDEGERVWGLGEQFREPDLVGSVTPILVREQGIGRGEQPITFLADVTNWAGGNLTSTYAAWPSWVTSAGRSFTLADTVPSGSFGIADLSHLGRIGLESWAPEFHAQVTAAHSPVEAVRLRAEGLRRPPLADWVQHGAILGIQGGTERVRRVVADMTAAGTKLSAVWLQDWTGQRRTDFGDRLWWTWQLDRQRYPGWRAMVGDLARQDIRVLTYVNPWLVDAAEKNDPDIRNLYVVAERLGYLVRRPGGGPYLIDQNGFKAALVDFTDPGARHWYADIIKNDVLGTGASGFIADFGEGLPYDAVLHRGNAAKLHNRWPQMWASVVREACDLAGQPQCVTFMRSSFLGSPKDVPLMWAGDQMVDFSEQDGLASAIHGMLAGGVSGSPLWHSDIGGYTSVNALLKDYVRPPDLNERWAEMQTFGVVMRTHETNRPAQNQQVFDTPQTRAAFARSSQIYSALYDYRKTVIDEAVAEGLPAMRPPSMVYPGTAAADASLEFFLGAHLLVAPVTSQDATTVDVSFPPGTWVHVLTGQRFEGDQVASVAAPLGTPAAFVRAGDPVGDRILDALTQAGLTG